MPTNVEIKARASGLSPLATPGKYISTLRMFRTPASYSLIALILTGLSTQVSAVEKYTVSVGSAGYGSLCIFDDGTVRGVIRHLGKPMSFSTKIADGEFEISAKSRAGVLDAQFVVSGENVGATATFAGKTVSINVSPYDGDAPAFCGKLVPVSVSIRAEAGNSLLNGSLTAAGKFIPSQRYKSPLNLKFNKKTGLVGGKLGNSPFIGIITNDIISAICDNGTRISVRPTLPISAPVVSGSISTSAQVQDAPRGLMGAQLVEFLAAGTGRGRGNSTATVVTMRTDLGAITPLPADLVLDLTAGAPSGVVYSAIPSSASLSNWFALLPEQRPPALIANVISSWAPERTPEQAAVWLQSIPADRLEYAGGTSTQAGFVDFLGSVRDAKTESQTTSGALTLNRGALYVGDDGVIGFRIGSTAVGRTYTVADISGTDPYSSGSLTVGSVSGSSATIGGITGGTLIMNGDSVTPGASVGTISSVGAVVRIGAGVSLVAGGTQSFTGTTSITNGTVNLTAIPSSPLNVQLSGSGSLNIAAGIDRAQLQGTVTVAPDWVNTTNLGVNINGTIIPLTPGTYPLSAIVVIPAN